uniref:CSON000452 protein n=1 Tax=Culicoides sonorensis TaxID=179676 RepID=A0A336MF43_CULSO
MKLYYSILITFSLIFVTFADVVNFSECSDEDSKQCSVNELRITPCTNTERCVFKRGESVDVTFDFTPEFQFESAKNKVFAKINGEWVDWIGGLEEDACGAVECPVTSNSKSTYSKAIKLAKTTQAGKFDVKWKLYNADDTQSCCFELKVQVKK